MQYTEPHSLAQPLEQVITSVRSAAEGWNLAPDDTIFINGSRVEGFENQYSDVDIWLVSKNGPGSTTSIPVFCWTDGLHINSSAYAEEHMLALAALVNGIDVEDYTQVRELPLNTLVRYYRVAVATPVVPQGLASLQSNFSKGHLAKTLARWAHIRSITSLRDAEALLAEGHEFLAFMAARNAVDCAIDSYLATNGEANPSLKWRFEKLARRFGQTSELYTDAWDLKSKGARTSKEYLVQTRKFIERLLSAGVEPAPVQPKIPESVHMFNVGDEAFLVQYKTHMYQLGVDARDVVGLIDGVRTDEEIAKQLAKQGNLSANLQRVRAVLNRMRQYGLVATYPDGR